MRIRVSKIIVGKFIFEYTNEVHITKSWKNLADTCKIKLPRRYATILDNNQKTTLDKVLKMGDKIEVFLGYDFELKNRFNGYLKSIKPNYPVEIEAEDEMYIWKRTKVSPKAFRGGDVAEILTHIGIKKYKLVGNKVSIGDFRITTEMGTVARVLEKIKEESHLPVFMRKGILHIGGQNPISSEDRTTHKFIVGKNIISHSLEYILKEENPVEVEVISKHSKGGETKVTVPPKGTYKMENETQISKHTISANDNIKDKTILEKLGYAQLDKLSYTGWKGKIKVFGEPLVDHGDIIELEDIDEGIIKGAYFADTIEISATMSEAYSQEIELGQILR